MVLIINLRKGGKKLTKIVQENEEIQKNMRDLARKMMKEKEVDVILGYAEGTIPLSISPIFIDKEGDVDKLVWNNSCYINLAKYLVPPPAKVIDGKEIKIKVGVISKGCVARAIIHLAVEKQVNLENVKIIGIPCNGIINRARIKKEMNNSEITSISFNKNTILVKNNRIEKEFPYQEYLNDLCKTCKIKSPPLSPIISENIVGASEEVTNIEDSFEDLSEYEAKTPDEKFKFIQDALKSCTRCYACREACPLCYCTLCFVDQNLPSWFGKATELSDIIVFHLIRAVHLAGRCVGCGACSSVCPMGINLNFINRKLEEIVKRRFDFVSGVDLETVPPMMTQKMNDKQEFILGED